MHEGVDRRYHTALREGFALANELNCEAGPVHLLAGIAEVEGPVAVTLRDTAGMSLRQAAAAVTAGGSMYLQIQAQGAARDWAISGGERVQPEHLLVALLDQRTSEVLDALQLTGIDAEDARRGALRALGAVEDLPRRPMPTPTPAGTLDRAPLPVDELPSAVWEVLRWRQEHLPLQRLKRRSDWAGLYHLESGAAWRVAARAGVDDDTRYSLLNRHNQEVQRRAAAAAPDVLPAAIGRRPGAAMGGLFVRRHRRRPRVPNVFVGWGTWFKNRAVGLNACWFRLTTLHHYRGQPRPSRSTVTNSYQSSNGTRG